MPATLPDWSRAADGLFDSHCHLADAEFASDVDAVLTRAADSGVAGILAVGYDLATSRRSVEIASGREWIRAAVGIHPNQAHVVDPSFWAEIAHLAADPRVVAIGETGLDHFRDTTPRTSQADALEWHLSLASTLRKPVILHNRDADEDLLAIVSDWASAQRRGGWDGPLGVMHCFGGDVALAERSVALGLMVSIAGNVTYRTAERVRAVATVVPDDWLLIETDAPYLPPVPHRGRRCEPAHLIAIARAVASLRHVEMDELSATTARNAQRLLRLERREPASTGVRTVHPG